MPTFESVRAVRMQRERGDSWVQISLSWSDNDAYPLGSSETIVISADYTFGASSFRSTSRSRSRCRSGAAPETVRQRSGVRQYIFNIARACR
jgi:hypothetical protein